MASKKKARKSRQKAWEELTDRGKLRRISKSPYYSQYMTERRRVQRLTRRLEREGYQPTVETLPPIPKKLTPASIRTVQKRTEKYIKDRSDFMALTDTDQYAAGDVIREAKVKKRRTKREAVSQAQEELARQQAEQEQEEHREFERRRRELDREQRERLERDAELRRQLSEGGMIADSIEGLISNIEDTFSRELAKYARNAWEHALKDDRQALYRRLAEHPEVIDKLKDSYYQNKSGDHFRPTEFNNFVNILQGTAMSAKEMQDVNDKYERSQALYPDIDASIED